MLDEHDQVAGEHMKKKRKKKRRTLWRFQAMMLWPPSIAYSKPPRPYCTPGVETIQQESECTNQRRESHVRASRVVTGQAADA
jgi:hypothetical protein